MGKTKVDKLNDAVAAKKAELEAAMQELKAEAAKDLLNPAAALVQEVVNTGLKNFRHDFEVDGQTYFVYIARKKNRVSVEEAEG